MCELKSNTYFIQFFFFINTKVRTINTDSSKTSGVFYNDKSSHTIYEFDMAVDPEFATDQTPQQLILLPVVNRQEIHNIILNVLEC